MLSPPRSRLLCGEVTPSAGSSDLSARLVSLHHESSPSMYRCDDVFEVDSHAPCLDQIGVCPQSDQMPDHGLPMKQQTDVSHAQGRATPVLTCHGDSTPFPGRRECLLI